MNKSVVILPLLIILFSSCLNRKPSRRNVSADSTTAVIADTATVAQKFPIQTDIDASEHSGSLYILNVPMLSPEKQELVNSLMPLWNRTIDFKTFKGKAKMHYEGSGMNQDFTANIRMAKDSVIWIHITAGMGIVNVARILITPDSFLMLNYLEKSAMKMPISDVKKLLPASVDFSVLQNLIIGEALSRNGQPTDATDFGGTWSLDITDPEVKQQANYNKADSTMRSLQVLSLNNAGFVGIIQFGNYSIVNDRKFPISRAINFTSDNQPHYFDMNFNNASFDEETDYPFSIPDSYALNK